MAVRSNYHTHSTYCDGRDTPGEMAEAAFAEGFLALGFSGHCDPAFSGCGMTAEGEEQYRRDIAALRAAYDGRMEIYCGIEQDYFSGFRAPGYDFAIGSVHWIEKDGCHLGVDWALEKTAENVAVHYGGDPYAYAADYYALVARVRERTGCDIIGHFDLLTKFSELSPLLDEADPRYRRAVSAALDALGAPGQIFEINTGAMARGYRTVPYPALWILKELRRRKCAVMINSDCHDRRKLTCGFDLAQALAREAGFSGRIVLRGGAFQETAL